VDGDGHTDAVNAAWFCKSVFWLKNPGKAGHPFERVEIDKTWSQVHFLLAVDLDDDGEREIVTGKRFRAHNGRDPGAKEPPCVMLYRYDRAEGIWNRQVLTKDEGVGFGINTMAADVDADGDLDLAAPGKSGLYLLENEIGSPGA